MEGSKEGSEGDKNECAQGLIRSEKLTMFASTIPVDWARDAM